MKPYYSPSSLLSQDIIQSLQDIIQSLQDIIQSLQDIIQSLQDIFIVYLPMDMKPTLFYHNACIYIHGHLDYQSQNNAKAIHILCKYLYYIVLLQTMKQEKLPKNKLQLRNQLLFLPFSISLTRYFFEILQDNYMLIYYDDNTDSSNFYIPLKNYNGKWWYAIQVMSEKISDGDAWVIDIQLEHRNKTNDSVISSNQKNNAIKAVFLTNIL